MGRKPPGEDHTIQVVNNGGGYTDADGFAVNLFAVGNGNYDDFDYGHITYFNSSSSIWTHSTPWPLAYAQTESWDKTQSDGFRFTFSGNSVTYWYSKARNRGWVGVIIDGEDKGIIDPYNYSSIFQVPKQYSELGSGTHTIEITVMGPPWKNEDSSDYYIDLDRFSVP